MTTAEAREKLERAITRLGGVSADAAEEIDEFAEAVREESRKRKTLDDCRWFVEAVNSACMCGGNGPGDGCPACKVYHSLKNQEI